MNKKPKHKSSSKPEKQITDEVRAEQDKAAMETFAMFGEISAFVERVTTFCERQKTCSTLRMLAERSTNALNKLTESKPDFDRSVVQRELTWPYMASPATHAIERMKAYFIKIGLGENHSLQIDAQKFNLTETSARKWVLEGLEGIRGSLYKKASFKIIRENPEISKEKAFNAFMKTRSELEFQRLTKYEEFIFEEAPKLPKLTVKTAEIWFPVFKAQIMHMTKEHPEFIPELRYLGLKQADAKIAYSPAGTRSYESNVRAGIFMALKSVLKNIARNF